MSCLLLQQVSWAVVWSKSHHERDVVLLEVRDVVARGQRPIPFPRYFGAAVRPREGQKFPVGDPVKVAMFHLTKTVLTIFFFAFFFNATGDEKRSGGRYHGQECTASIPIHQVSYCELSDYQSRTSYQLARCSWLDTAIVGQIPSCPSNGCTALGIMCSFLQYFSIYLSPRTAGIMRHTRAHTEKHRPWPPQRGALNVRPLLCHAMPWRPKKESFFLRA